MTTQRKWYGGLPNVCSEAGISVRFYSDSKIYAVVDSDNVELRQFNDQDEAIEYALNIACDRFDLDSQDYGHTFL